MDKDKDDVEELVPYSLCYRALTFFYYNYTFPLQFPQCLDCRPHSLSGFKSTQHERRRRSRKKQPF